MSLNVMVRGGVMVLPGPSFARGGLFPSEKTANPCQPTCPTCPVGLKSLKNFGPRMPENSRSRKRLQPFQHVPHVSSFTFRGPYKRLPVCLRPKSLHSRLSSLYLLTLYCRYVCAYPTGSCPTCPLCTFCQSSRVAPTPAVKST